jgi:hypothetical protein
MIDDPLRSPLPTDPSEIAGILAAGVPEMLDTMDDAAVVACWSDQIHDCGEVMATVTLGSPHVLAGPIYRVTVQQVHGDEAESLRRHLGECYDAREAETWDETPEEFCANLEDGHLYDAYRPWPGGPAWSHRGRHAAWAAQQRAEAATERQWEGPWSEATAARVHDVEPQPPLSPPVAGASDHPPGRPGSGGRRARRKQQRQARRQGRR